MQDNDRFDLVIKAIDNANAQDPNQEEWNGVTHPKELIYGQRMSETLLDFKPDASETLRLAARGQHICRWEIPRVDFPMDRKGYHAWRNKLKEFHADKMGELMTTAGYESDTISTVASLLKKEKLKLNPETQALEDVICLVFLTYYFDAFANKYEEEKLIGILQKTWGKMSDKGREKALTIKFSSKAHDLIKKALA